ncbi:MAG: hypothetical protein ACTSRQ_13620, partial [Candidatus Thorarchaeota archaeon]
VLRILLDIELAFMIQLEDPSTLLIRVMPNYWYGYFQSPQYGICFCDTAPETTHFEEKKVG